MEFKENFVARSNVFESLASLLSPGIIVLNPSHEIEYINKSAAEMLMLPAGSRSIDHVTFFPDEQRPQTETPIQPYDQATPDAPIVDERYILKNMVQLELPILLSATRLQSDAGETVGTLLVLRKSNRMRRVPEANIPPQDSERIFRTLIENLQGCLTRWLPDSTLVYANANYLALFDLPDDYAGLKWLDYLPADSREATFQHYSRLRKYPVESTYSQYFTDRQGVHRCYLWTDIPIFDEDGDLSMFQSIGIDISERVQDEETQRHQRAHLLENMADAVIIADVDLTIQHWNRAAEELYGWQASEVIGKPSFPVLQNQYPEGNREELIKLFMDTGSWKGEVLQRHKDGHTILVMSSAKLIRDQYGRPVQVLVINHDISKQRQIQETLEKTVRLKDEFLANMSHELRTPLNAILGLAEALRIGAYGKVNQEQVETLLAINKSGHHLLSLINDILDLAKIEAGKMELELAPVNLETICLESLQFVRQMAREKQLQIVTRFDSHVNMILADERRLKQILVNLLSNAVKFTPPDGEISLGFKGIAGEQIVEITVTDTGIGISTADQTLLFQSFVQASSGLDRSHEGTGLGLALVYRMVTMHGGSIALDSKVGEGSSFTIRLPWQDNVPSAAARRTSGGDTAIENALLIEDSLIDARIAAEYLESLGITVRRLAEDENVHTIVKQTWPDLIVLDILLPKESGWKILETLKNDPFTQSIPILVVSALDQPEKGFSLGADGYLVKPLEKDQLQAEIERLSISHQAATALLVATGAPLILLAEDNELSIRPMQDFLRSLQYRVQVARNGQVALELAQEERPDIVLMDIQMPVVDGLTTIKKMRALDTLQDVPILAVTALAMPGDKEKCLAAGATAYLSKPISLLVLEQELRQHLPSVRKNMTSS